jgi:hypothetical protein
VRKRDVRIEVNIVPHYCDIRMERNVHKCEEHRLRVFENRVLRRILGPKRDEVTGGWRTLHNEELHGL